MHSSASRAAVSSAVVVVSAFATGAFAQPAQPTAATVLGNVQQFYANTSHMTAQFRQTVNNATFNTTKASDGRLWIAKPTQFRFDYNQKQQNGVVVAKTFTFDGSTLWMIDHQNKQIVQISAQNSALPAAVTFLTGSSNLTAQFDVTFDTSGAYGSKTAAVLELTPKQPSAQYKQLIFVVEPSDSHISESVVIDANGDVNDFKFYSPDLTSTVKPTWFRVIPSNLPTYKVSSVSSQAAQPSLSSSPTP